VRTPVIFRGGSGGEEEQGRRGAGEVGGEEEQGRRGEKEKRSRGGRGRRGAGGVREEISAAYCLLPSAYSSSAIYILSCSPHSADRG